jgi:IS1 family transposase
LTGLSRDGDLKVRLEAEVDEQWSYVGAKSKQRRCWYIDDWGAYLRHLDVDQHEIGKRNTQKIERKNLSLRT